MDKVCYIANYEHLGKVCWGNATMRKLFDAEEERLNKYSGVKYGWDNEAYTYDNFAEEDPELLQRMQEMAKAYPGRIQVGAVSYGQPLSFYINGESNVRQLVQGVRTCLEYFGYRPYVYNMSEHGMHAQIPQLIAQAGFTGAVMRTSFCMYGLNPEYPASCIDWRGLDGTMGVPTVPCYPGEQCHCAVNGYTHDRRTREFPFFGANTMDNKILLDYSVDSPWGGLEEFRDRFGGRIKNVIAYRADDPRQPEGFVAEYHNKPGFEWVLDEDILKAAGEPEMEVVSKVNDFHVRMPWGLCGNWIWEKCRLQESRLYAADMVDAVRAMAGEKAHPDELRDAWKMLLICQHHDVQICGIENDARKFFARGDKDLEVVEADMVGDAPEYRFNPLPWKRQDENGEGALSVVTMPRNRITDCTCDDETLETPWYIVQLNPDGGFDSVVEKETGRSLFRKGRRSGVLTGVIDGVNCIEEGVWNHEAVSGGMTVTDAGWIGSIPYSVRWTFYDKHPRVDCTISIEASREFIGRKTNDYRDAMSAFIHDEKLRMKFYPDLPDSAMGWRDQPYGAAATNRQSIECNHWASVSDGENGFAIFNKGIQCAAREYDGALSVPVAYSMYYVWSGTITSEGVPNDAAELYETAELFRPARVDDYYLDEEFAKLQRDEPARSVITKHFMNGEYITHLAFMPYTGTWEDAQLHRRALEYNNPCVPISAETARLMRETALRVSVPENVFISSVYHADGETYIRLYEMEGKDGVTSVTLQGEDVKLMPVDFFENPVGEAVEEAALKAHEVRTYRLVKA